MSMFTLAYLIENHGLRLDLEALAKCLGSTPANLRRKISDQTLGIATYIDGGKRYADVRDVAEYFDTKRKGAAKDPAGVSA